MSPGPRRPASLVLVRPQLRLADDLLLHVARHQIVVAELHRIGALPLRDAAELGRVGATSASGALAVMTARSPGRLSWFSTRARFVFRSPRIAPVYFDGAVTSRLTIGSSSTGRAARKAFLNAMRPAVLNAASELSTGWSLPK